MTDAQTRYRLVPYVNPNGKIPVQEFLDGLAESDPDAAALFHYVTRPLVEESGPALGMPHFRHLPPTDFSEIRWDGKDNAHYRIYCSVEKGGRLLLLHAVRKRWLKFDKNDKAICRQRYTDYQRGEYNAHERLARRTRD